MTIIKIKLQAMNCGTKKPRRTGTMQIFTPVDMPIDGRYNNNKKVKKCEKKK